MWNKHVFMWFVNVPVLSLLQFNFGGFEGRNPAPVDVVDIPAFLDVLYIPGGDGRISEPSTLRPYIRKSQRYLHCTNLSKIPSLSRQAWCQHQVCQRFTGAMRGLWSPKASARLEAAAEAVQHWRGVLPSLKLTWPLKIDGWKMNFLLGRPIFWGYVRFREGKDFNWNKLQREWGDLVFTWVHVIECIRMTHALYSQKQTQIDMWKMGGL